MTDRPRLPGLNVDALRRELEFVTDHPERWEQSCWLTVEDEPTVEPGRDWTCGTSACLAGWTALHADHVPRVIDYGDGDLEFADDEVVAPSGEVFFVRDVAVRVLGLNRAAATALFDASNNLRDLWEYARVLSGGELTPPPAVLEVHPHMFMMGDDDHYRARFSMLSWYRR